MSLAIIYKDKELIRLLLKYNGNVNTPICQAFLAEPELTDIAKFIQEYQTVTKATVEVDTSGEVKLTS